ncbi:maspardin [Tetranychus urticae]|uniref:Maspardin n=1 Tax=Tetranychus urticae TaxID=32264 RepID=T1K1Q0_TETUR|nr:maspardin [Tetranychus urticae]
MTNFFNIVSGTSGVWTSDLSNSEAYQSFRANIPLRKIVVDSDSSKQWTLYDAGPKEITSPLIFLPPVSGIADVFFLQITNLSKMGYRVISLEYPIYWSLAEFIYGFIKLIDHLQLDKVHVFGASLGGFLIQKFAELTSRCPRVQSIIVCNSFPDTAIFHRTDSATLFWMMPPIILKKLIMGNRSSVIQSRDKTIQDSIDFMNERLESLSQPELASRLTLNCLNCYVEPHKLQKIPVTILDVFDKCAISERVKQELYKMYPNAKRAHLKTGGDFPYLSRPDEVNMHIVIHLRQFEGTRYSPKIMVKPIVDLSPMALENGSTSKSTQDIDEN